MTISKDMLATKWGEFVGLNKFGDHALQDGRFSVVLDEARFECLLEKKASPYLFVMLSGARDPARHPIPKFDRWSWKDRFPGSVLYISDPTLYLDTDHLRIGWYVGTSKYNWLQSMALLVAHIAGRLGVASRRVISYGSSAGGFAALMLAAALDDAAAVAINPQTDVRSYWPSAVEKLLDVAFDGRRADQLSPDEVARLSAIAAFRRSPRARCLLVQNLQDKMHYNRHYIPFCKTFNVPEKGGMDSRNRIISITFDSPNGHLGAEPKELVPELIHEAIRVANLDPLSVSGKSEFGERIEAGQIYLLGTNSRQSQKWNGGDYPFRASGREDLGERCLSFPLDWDEDPFNDRNWCAQLHMWRMIDHHMMQHDKTRDASWLDFPLAVIRDWHRHHQVESRTSRFAWADMLVGVRAMKLAYLMSQIQHGCLQVDTETDSVFNELVQTHLEFLLDGTNVRYNNHTFFDLQGVAALAQVVDQRLRARIYEFIEHVLPKQISSQFTEHGVHKENSPDYHSLCNDCLKRLRNSGWFENFCLDDLITQAEGVLSWFLMPDGRVVPIGDTAGKPWKPAVAATVFQGSGVFNSSGYAIVRQDGGGDVRKSSFLSVMGAFNSRTHKHADDLSCVWFEGEDILCDAGKFAYKTDPFRSYAQSTPAHNTVEIDGRSYDVQRGVVYGSAIGAVALHDWGYLIDANVRHQIIDAQHARFLMYRPSAWLLVIDHLVGGRPHDFTQWFHFAPHLPDLQSAGNEYSTQLSSGRRLRVCAAGSATLSSSVQKGMTEPRVQGWISQSYAKVTPCCSLGYRQRGRDVVFATLFALDEEGSTVVLQDRQRLVFKVAARDRMETFRISIGQHSCRVRKS